MTAVIFRQAGGKRFVAAQNKSVPMRFALQQEPQCVTKELSDMYLNS
jgi:hypothetical protein